MFLLWLLFIFSALVIKQWDFYSDVPSSYEGLQGGGGGPRGPLDFPEILALDATSMERVLFFLCRYLFLKRLCLRLNCKVLPLQQSIGQTSMHKVSLLYIQRQSWKWHFFLWLGSSVNLNSEAVMPSWAQFKVIVPFFLLALLRVAYKYWWSLWQEQFRTLSNVPKDYVPVPSRLISNLFLKWSPCLMMPILDSFCALFIFSSLNSSSCLNLSL